MQKLITAESKRASDFEKLFDEKILPVYTEFNYNLNNVNRFINKDVQANIRPMVSSLSREFDRLLRENNFNEDKLS